MALWRLMLGLPSSNRLDLQNYAGAFRRVAKVRRQMASQPEGEQDVTIAQLMADPVTAVAKVTNEAIKQLEKSASVFVAIVGFALIVFSALDVTVLAKHSGFDQLSTGKFDTLVITGFVLLLVGGSFRMFLGYRKSELQRSYQEWVQSRAGLEADAQIRRTEKINEKALEGPPAGGVNP